MLKTDPTMRTWAEIDLGAMRSNLDIALSTGKKVMCVIKADGYGHGAVRIGEFLQKNGASAFAVACLDEAIVLRQAGISLPLLILGYVPAECAKVLAGLNIQSTIVDMEAAVAMNEAAKCAGVIVSVHIKIDTGMSRLGFLAQTPKQIGSTVDSILECVSMENLSIKGIFTHFSVADTLLEDAYTQWQYRNFAAVKNALEAKAVNIPVHHISNSAAIMNYPEVHFDMVREGIMLYGLYPDSVPHGDKVLRPVMTLKTRVAQIKEYPAGTTISYGRTYKTEKTTKIAVLPVGYADGYPRRQSNMGIVYINGKSYPQVGRVCMDMCMVDVSDSDIKRGDIVTLFGNGGCTLEQVAQNVGTINYELACLITSRVPRVYIGE